MRNAFKRTDLRSFKFYENKRNLSFSLVMIKFIFALLSMALIQSYFNFIYSYLIKSDQLLILKKA